LQGIGDAADQVVLFNDGHVGYEMAENFVSLTFLGTKIPAHPHATTPQFSLLRHPRNVGSERLKRPDQQDHRDRDKDDDDFEWQPHTPVITKTVTTRTHHQGIVLVSDWR
jgi:hypothetical protein